MDRVVTRRTLLGGRSPRGGQDGFTLVEMLVVVKNTTRLRAGVKIVGNAFASNLAPTVQYITSTSGHETLLGSARSPLIHSLAAS